MTKQTIHFHYEPMTLARQLVTLHFETKLKAFDTSLLSHGNYEIDYETPVFIREAVYKTLDDMSDEQLEEFMSQVAREHNNSQDSKSFKILAEKDDTHLHELTITIDIDSQKASILLTTRLFWNDFEELSVPGHNVKLAIEGEYDYNYNYNHDFIITAKKRKSNVKHQDLTTTIDSMMKEIENAYQALTT